MASGLEMMLKAMGIDVQQLMAEFGGQLQKFQDAVETVMKRLDDIDNKLGEIDLMMKASRAEELDRRLVQPYNVPEFNHVNGGGDYGEGYEINEHRS